MLTAEKGIMIIIICLLFGRKGRKRVFFFNFKVVISSKTLLATIVNIAVGERKISQFAREDSWLELVNIDFEHKGSR